ncbi:GFA family protein [Alisedimentitalea sp. MJ-SS2]|uniref:GFA family protein n=1 Tax=Aliisedimentitalea sp. MJ-SS2 TaxID=3049795 RepID=UPI00290E32FA|nr:GFA family protein [Alisedimentitalea sp. MJ-SS2]MDU8927571.1 GFA family protein [Alisedimentitalea sp. MJ-SS2]
MRGRCLCGRIKCEVDEPVQSCVNCHCGSCRRQFSAPMATFIGVSDKQWRWTTGAPKVFHSSPGAERTFCGNCGTPLPFRSEKMSGVMHFIVAALDE